MTDGLKDAHRTAIVNVLHANGRVERAVLFGSRAMETFTRGSDVDIALFGEALTTADQARLAAAMEELTVPQRVDLLLYDGIEDAALRKHVRRDGIELYRKQENALASRLNVPETHRRTLVSLLREHLPGVEVWAYGSRVNGCGHNGSDLDLVLRGPGLKEIPASRLADFEEGLRESLIPFLVEARDWARLPERFHREVEREHVVLVSGERMAGDWREVTIGEIADVVGGSTPPTKAPDNFDGDIPWLTPKDLSGPHNRYVEGGERNLSRRGLKSCSAKLLPTGSVLLSTRAPIGYVALAKNPIATNQGFLGILCKEEASAEYVYYWLIQNTAELKRHASGSTFQELSGTSLKNLHLRLPPLSEQRAITHVLGTLDDKIELNRRMNETLEAMARAIFKDWFVDFGPVRAKMEGREPGLPPHIAGLFPDRLVDSELGQMPEGWEVRTLGNLCHKPQYGYTASAKSEPVGPRFLRITDINKESWVFWSRVPYCEGTDDDLFRYRLSAGDLLIARMADPGHGILIEEDIEGVFASYLIRFKPIESYHARLLQYWIKSDAYWQRVKGHAAGTTRVSLNAKVLSSFPLVVPSNAVAGAFATVVGTLRSRLVKSATEMESFAAMRDTLLPKLVSGELRISDANTVFSRTKG